MRLTGCSIHDLRPVECEDGHSQSGGSAEQLVDNDVVRDNPADPVEVRERAEEVAGEEVPTERADEDVEEEPLAGDTAAGSHAGVVLGVKGVEQRAGDQVGGPDHRGRLHQEAASDTTDGEPNLYTDVNGRKIAEVCDGLPAVWT